MGQRSRSAKRCPTIIQPEVPRFASGLPLYCLFIAFCRWGPSTSQSRLLHGCYPACAYYGINPSLPGSCLRYLYRNASQHANTPTQRVLPSQALDLSFSETEKKIFRVRIELAMYFTISGVRGFPDALHSLPNSRWLVPQHVVHSSLRRYVLSPPIPPFHPSRPSLPNRQTVPQQKIRRRGHGACVHGRRDVLPMRRATLLWMFPVGTMRPLKIWDHRFTWSAPPVGEDQSNSVLYSLQRSL